MAHFLSNRSQSIRSRNQLWKVRIALRCPTEISGQPEIFQPACQDRFDQHHLRHHLYADNMQCRCSGRPAVAFLTGLVPWEQHRWHFVPDAVAGDCSYTETRQSFSGVVLWHISIDFLWPGPVSTIVLSSQWPSFKVMHQITSPICSYVPPATSFSHRWRCYLATVHSLSLTAPYVWNWMDS